MTSTPATRPSRPTMTARSPEDLLAAVPVVLGFHPEESVAMLTFGAADAFHARVDLPHDDEALASVLDALLDPARRHRVRQVAFVLYTADARIARRTGRELVRRFTSDGIDVVEVLRVAEGRWFVPLGSRSGVPEWGVPFDVSAHPFTAHAVLDGQVLQESRDGVGALVAGDAAAAARVERAGQEPGAGETLSPAELTAWLDAHAAAGSTAPDEELARVLASMAEDVYVRDAALVGLDRASARARVDVWADAVRRAPSPWVPAPAAVLALTAWVAGTGALAWCAIERCLAVDPSCRLAQHVAAFLQHAVPPSVWLPLDPGDLERPVRRHHGGGLGH